MEPSIENPITSQLEVIENPNQEILQALLKQNQTLQTILNYIAVTFWGSIFLGILLVFALN